MVVCFFFFKQKTAYEMRISDWSSDVCSSDLGTGFTSLPPVREVLEKKIARSIASFAEGVELPGPERYMFVLEDNDSGAMQGCCAIEAACGLDEPFYNYHVGLIVQASPATDVYKRLPTLRSEAHTPELQTIIRISYTVLC